MSTEPNKNEKLVEEPKEKKDVVQQNSYGKRTKRDTLQGNSNGNSIKSDNNNNSDDNIGTCFGGLDDEESRKLKEELDRAREEGQNNYSTKSRCVIC